MAGAAGRALLCGALALAAPLTASAWEFAGMAAFDNRIFLDSPAFPGQRDTTYYPSVMLQPELRHAWNGGQDRLTVIPFARLDPADNERRHWDLREFNWQHAAGAWDLKIGVGKEFWGVTESRHLVDIINQTDFIEDVDEKEKLGQPMLNLNLSGDFGSLALFALPLFRARPFEDRIGRFRFALPIDARHPRYESSQGARHPDLAARWSKTFGEWDVGVSHFRGTSREPRFDLTAGDVGPTLIPRYDIINQTGLDVQWTRGTWLWKLEAISRGGQNKRFQAAVAGFEYTIFDLKKSGINLGLVAEYLYDGRSADPTKNSPTPYNNDAFVGMRLSLEDTQNTELLAGMMRDRDTGSKMVRIEGSRRLGNSWKIALDIRIFKDAPPPDFVLFGFHRDSYAQVRIAHYF